MFDLKKKKEKRKALKSKKMNTQELCQIKVTLGGIYQLYYHLVALCWLSCPSVESVTNLGTTINNGEWISIFLSDLSKFPLWNTSFKQRKSKPHFYNTKTVNI